MQTIKQWKHCWYLDFFIIFDLLIVKNYDSFLFWKKKIARFWYLILFISLTLKWAPPSDKRRTSVSKFNKHLLEEIQYSLKNFWVKAMVIRTVFEILRFEGRSVLWPAQRVARRERVKSSILNCLKSDWLKSLGGFE